MFNLENVLAINKHNYNWTPSLSETTSDLKLFDRLEFNFVFPDKEIISLDESTLEHLKNTPKFLRDWQADDMRTNTVGGYYKNPVGDSINLVLTYIEEIIKLIIREEVDIDTNREVEVVVDGLDELRVVVEKAKTVSEQFSDHTNRLSNVVPVYPNPERPHYLTSMAVNRVMEYIIFQTDRKEDTETILSCFTALFTNAAIAEFAISYEELVELIKNNISFSTVMGDDGTYTNIYTTTLTPEELRNIIQIIETANSYMESRVQHDYRVWKNVKILMEEYNQFRVMNNMGETQKKLIDGYIGTDKLKASLEIEDLPPTKYAVDIDYYGNTIYTIVPVETELPPNTAITIIDDYINYYNIANLEILIIPPYTDFKVDADPGALIFNTTNGVWSNNRTVNITNTGNAVYAFSNVIFNNFSSSEFRYNFVPANTASIYPGNTAQFIVAARGMTTGNTVDYGTINIIPGIRIEAKVNSNTYDTINPTGILLPSQIVAKFGSNTNPLILNANNGPYPILADSEGFNYTWKNESDYPVTISTIDNLTDSANLTNMTITLFGANTAQTLNVANGITLNTSESVLWYANVVPHITKPNNAIYKISTIDGQERLMYIGVYGGNNDIPGDGEDGEDEPGGGVDDSNSYNEVVSTDPDIIIAANTFDLVMSSGKPRTQILYSGPDVSGSAYLDANGYCVIENLNITANGYYTYSVNFVATGHQRNITKAIFSS